MSKHSDNTFNTNPLTLSVMAHCARHLNVDIDDDVVSDKLYWVCCDLESWPEGEGFGTSDHWGYVDEARVAFESVTEEG